MITLLHSEQPKHNSVLAVLSVIGLSLCHDKSPANFNHLPVLVKTAKCFETFDHYIIYP